MVIQYLSNDMMDIHNILPVRSPWIKIAGAFSAAVTLSGYATRVRRQ